MSAEISSVGIVIFDARPKGPNLWPIFRIGLQQHDAHPI